MRLLSITAFGLIATLRLGGSNCLAAAASPALAKAKQDAEARGYAFLSTHEEIIAHAKHSKVRKISSPSFALVARDKRSLTMTFVAQNF